MSKNIGRIVGRASREEPVTEDCSHFTEGTMRDCIHPTVGKVRRWGYEPVITRFFFCPMCGVKL